MTPSQPILVVEPDPDIRDGFCEYLQLSGYRVTVAIDETEALEAIRLEVPSVVLLDLPLTGLASNPLLHLLEGTPALGSVPVVLLVGMPPRYYRLRPKGLRNVRRILVKPVELDVLLGALRDAMGWVQPVGAEPLAPLQAREERPHG